MHNSEEFLKSEYPNAAESTLMKYRGALKRILKAYKKEIKTSEDLNDFIRWGRKKYGGHTFNDTIKVLKGYLKWKYEDWEKRFRKFEKLKTKKVQQTKQDLLSAEEIEKLIRSATTMKHTAMIHLQNESGARPNELLRLRWKDFDSDKKKIKLFSSKNNTSRIIPLNNSVHSLRDWKQKYSFPNVKEKDLIFPNPNDKEIKLSVQSFSQYVSILGKKVLGRKISPYTLRHTRCNVWFNSGMNPKDYELVADHSYEVALKYYQQSNEERLQETFDNLYGIKELTKEEKNVIQELKERVNLLEKDLIFVTEFLDGLGPDGIKKIVKNMKEKVRKNQK